MEGSSFGSSAGLGCSVTDITLCRSSSTSEEPSSSSSTCGAQNGNDADELEDDGARQFDEGKYRRLSVEADSEAK